MYPESVVIVKALRSEYDKFKAMAKGYDQLKHGNRIHTFNLLGEETVEVDWRSATPGLLRISTKLFSANLEKRSLQVMVFVQTEDNLDCKATSGDSRCAAVTLLLQSIEHESSPKLTDTETNDNCLSVPNKYPPGCICKRVSDLQCQIAPLPLLTFLFFHC